MKPPWLVSTLVDGFAAPRRCVRATARPIRRRVADRGALSLRDATTRTGGKRCAVSSSTPPTGCCPCTSAAAGLRAAAAPDELAAYYRARREFDHLLRSPEFEIRFLLDAGELVMMDNRRPAARRTGFDPAQGLRHLQGCYIDIDGPRSLYRVLRRRQASKETGR